MSAVTNTQNIRRETAQRIVNESKSIEKLFNKLFVEVIGVLEETINKQLSSEVRNCVWEAASVKPIASLKTALIEELSTKIFTKLPDEEKLEAKMFDAYSSSQKEIVSFIEQKAKELFDPFVKDVLAAVEKEGFEVPEYE